ncbi:MAG: hypothetical protein ACJAT8_002061 [Cellvibrionaceae bacterium]|jgi:hypothetical protein
MQKHCQAAIISYDNSGFFIALDHTMSLAGELIDE